MQIHTTTQGQGPALVLIHGWGFHSGVWQSLLPALTPHYCVTCIDLPGFGNSPLNQKAYTLAELAEAVLAVAPERAHWLGWSMGGLVATAVARQAPTRVISLLNVASNPSFLAQSDWIGMERRVLEEFAASLATDYQATLSRFLALQMHGSNGATTLVRGLKQQLKSWGAPQPEALYYGLDILRHSDLRESLSQLTLPVLYVLGRLDALVPVAIHEKLLALNPKTNTVIIAGASHAPFLSHQEQFLKIINRFINEQ